MVFKKDLRKKYKIYTICKDIKNLKYVKSIKMYKILTVIHLNYKINKITFKREPEEQMDMLQNIYSYPVPSANGLGIIN